MCINNTSRPYASQRIQWAFRADLSAATARVAAALDTAPSKYRECWRSAEWISKQVGLSVSTVLKKLRELELKGLVEIVRDYGLTTRRRIVLLWREQPQPEPEPAEETMNHADEPTVATGVAPVAEAPRAEGPRETPPPSSRKATPQEVESLVKKAANLGSPSRRWVTDVAKKYGVKLTTKAVDHAVAKGKGRFGWVCEAVKAWAAEGVPDHLKTEEEGYAEQEEAFRRLFGPGGEFNRPKPVEPPRPTPRPTPAPEEDPRPAHLAWIESDNPFLRELAARALKGGR